MEVDARKSVIARRPPDEQDRRVVREFFSAMPLVERGKDAFSEVMWVLAGCPDEDRHVKALPEYCYNILAALRRTCLGAIPSMTDILFVKDEAAIAQATTMDAAKEVVRIDWRLLGRVCGIAVRCIRFCELEAGNVLEEEGLGDLPPDKTSELFTVICGKRWVEENESRIANTAPGQIVSDLIKQWIAPRLEAFTPVGAKCGVMACQWDAEAMTRFHEGFAEGMSALLDEQSQLTGETNRSGTYAFLLLGWPEIKVMLEAEPKKTLSDLHSWMLPFMRMGVTSFLDIEQLRDLCAPPSQHGIGLSLRPVKPRRKSPA